MAHPNDHRQRYFKLTLDPTSYTAPPPTRTCYFCSDPSTVSDFILCSQCRKDYHMECVFAREEDLRGNYLCPSCLRNSRKNHLNSSSYPPGNTSDHVVPPIVLNGILTPDNGSCDAVCPDACNNVKIELENKPSFMHSEHYSNISNFPECYEPETNGIFKHEGPSYPIFNSNGPSDEQLENHKSNHTKPKKVKTQSLFDETCAFLENCERRKRNRETLTKGDQYPNGSRLTGGPEDTSLQCLGPGCTNAARDSSKYCCDECGIQLAMDRIKCHLPQRLVEWEQGGESQAEKRDRERLSQINRDISAARAKLKQLEREGQRLNQLIARISKLPIVSSKDRFDHEMEDLMLDCPTCGMQFTMKKIQLHMEKCWAKIESSMTLSSYVKLEAAEFFCDKYDKKYNTYCKKLKIMCPEHTKDPKVGAHDVCGCPLVENLSILPPDNPSVKFCQLLKRNCRKHPFWEKMRRATIDQEKLIQWLKLDELEEQKKLIRGQLSTRKNLIALLLHRTIPANSGYPHF